MSTRIMGGMRTAKVSLAEWIGKAWRKLNVGERLKETWRRLNFGCHAWAFLAHLKRRAAGYTLALTGFLSALTLYFGLAASLGSTLATIAATIGGLVGLFIGHLACLAIFAAYRRRFTRQASLRSLFGAARARDNSVRFFGLAEENRDATYTGNLIVILTFGYWVIGHFAGQVKTRQSEQTVGEPASQKRETASRAA